MLVDGAGDHEQAVGAAAQPGGHVVEPVEPVQQLRVALVALQVVDEGELPADQVLGAPGDVGEHRRDVAAGADLPLQQQGRGRLDPVERRGQLADLVGTVDLDRGQLGRRRVGRVGVGHPDQLRSGQSATTPAARVSRRSGREIERLTVTPEHDAR